MRIIIVGGGVVGFSLAEQLRHENHDIVLIEKETATYEQIRNRTDIQILCGNGTSPALLETAGIKDADMVVAVTSFDEHNIVICAIAQQYGVERRIARIRSSEFREGAGIFDLKKLGVTLVTDPEAVLVDAITQFVETPGATDAVNFHEGNVLMRGYRVHRDMPLVGKTLRDIRKETAQHPLLFIAAIRKGEAIIPDGDYTIEPEDDMFGIFPRPSLEAFLNLFGRSRKEARNVIIAGTSLTAIQLARQVKDIVEKVVLIDPDYEHGRQAADILNDVDIIHGDATDAAILQEVYIRNADFFIAADKETDSNVMSSLLAKAEGAREVIAVINDVRHDRLFKSIGIDHVIHPRLAIANNILEKIHRGQIGRIVRIRNLDIEALRLTVDPDSPVTGKPLQHIRSKMQKGTIVGTLLRGDEMIIPDGNTIIEPGDKMIVITHSKNAARVRKLFKAR